MKRSFGGFLMNIYSILGQNIKKFRLEKHIMQEELAELCDFHRTFISSIERGKKGISLTNIEIIANKLNVKVYMLFLE
jgi:bamHI control element